MFERLELESFVAVAEELHFGRAAARLHVSNAQLSQTIRRLERQIGAPLFQRTTRKVELTRVGQRFLEDIRPAWIELTTTLDNAVRASRRLAGNLHVAFVSAAGSQFLIEINRRFHARHPECRVDLHEASYAEVWTWLADGIVDVALLPMQGAEPEMVMGDPIVSTPMAAALHLAHPLARAASVTFRDLSRSNVIQLPETLPPSLREFFAPASCLGDNDTLGPIANTELESLSLAAAGQGVALVGATTTARSCPRPDLRYIPISDAPLVTCRLVWHKHRETAAILSYNSCAPSQILVPS